jgi:hypothetical protein
MIFSHIFFRLNQLHFAATCWQIRSIGFCHGEHMAASDDVVPQGRSPKRIAKEMQQ